MRLMNMYRLNVYDDGSIDLERIWDRDRQAAEEVLDLENSIINDDDGCDVLCSECRLTECRHNPEYEPWDLDLLIANQQGGNLE